MAAGYGKRCRAHQQHGLDSIFSNVKQNHFKKIYRATPWENG
jgi:hypothetical protein